MSDGSNEWMNHSDECHKVDKAEKGGSEGWGVQAGCERSLW